jgi:hypothetical protein
MAEDVRLAPDQLVRIMASMIYAAELHANMMNKTARRDPDLEVCIDKAKHLLSVPVQLPPGAKA